MRQEVKDTVAEWAGKYLQSAKTIVELGALDVNGNMRDVLERPNRRYAGVDMQEGPNVDLVANAHNLDNHFPEGSIDAIVCCDMFEHDDAFWVTLDQIKKVLHRGSFFICSVPTINFANFHQHPDDYWRFTTSAFYKIIFDPSFYELVASKEINTPGISEAPDTYIGIGRVL